MLNFVLNKFKILINLSSKKIAIFNQSVNKHLIYTKVDSKNLYIFRRCAIIDSKSYRKKSITEF